MPLRKKRLVQTLIALSIVSALVLIFNLLKLNEAVAEYFFARGVSRAYVAVFGNVSRLFPFALFELIVLATIVVGVLVIIRLVILIKKRDAFSIARVATKVVLGVMCFALIYTLTASGNYYRKPLSLEVYEGKQLSFEETKELVLYYWDDYSKICDGLKYSKEGKSVPPYSFNELSELLRREYKRLDSDKYYSRFTPPAKKAVSSGYLTLEGICGITFMPTGEPLVSYQVPACYLTVTMAHEMAHAKGVMVEREANLLAYYLLISSEIPYLRYCGYMYCLSGFSRLLQYYDYDGYVKLFDEFAPKKAIADRRLEDAFWADKKSVINDIGEFFNDLYLRLSGLSDGTNNYSDPPSISFEEPEEPTEPPIPVIEYSRTVRMLIANAKRRSGN